MLRLRGGGGDDAPLPDSDDDFHLQVPTPPSATEEQDGDSAAAAATGPVAADDSDDEEMQIFVKGLRNTLCLQVLASDTITTIEALVQNKEYVSRSKFLLMFKGTNLEDGSRTLTDLKITNLSTLDMVLMSDVECYDNY